MKRAGAFFAFAITSVLAAPAARADASRAACVEAYERAQHLKKEDKLKEAREALVTCAQDACPAATRADCTPWLAEVERSLPTIVVAVNDAAGKDVLGAKISIDGAPYVGVEGAAIPVDPGPHKVKVEVKGVTMEESVVARVGEKLRRVVVTIRTPAPAPAPVLETKPETPPADTSGRSYVLPLVLTGVGVVGLATAFGVGVAAKSESNDLRATCAPRCTDDQIGAVETKLLVSDIALGIGIASLAVAVYFWVRPPGSSSSGSTGGTNGTRVSVGAHAVQLSF